MRKLVLAGAILALVPGLALAQSEPRICSQTIFQGYTYVQCNDGTTTILEAPQPAPESDPVVAPTPVSLAPDPDLTSPDPNVRLAAIVRDWPSP